MRCGHPDVGLAGPVRLDDVGHHGEQRERVGGLAPPAVPARSCRGRARRRAGRCGDRRRRRRPPGPGASSAAARRAASRRAASGSGMLVAAPLPTVSNERNSGPSSSQPASRRAWPRFCERGREVGHEERVGQLAGEHGLRDDPPLVRGRARPRRARGSSSSTSTPARSSIARRMSAAWSETFASSASSENSDGSRAAVWARIVAMPSSRLSSPSRLASVSPVSVWTRMRSSRASSATAWNRDRTETAWPRSTADSISRTARARIGMTPSLSRGRVRC